MLAANRRWYIAQGDMGRARRRAQYSTLPESKRADIRAYFRAYRAANIERAWVNDRDRHRRKKMLTSVISKLERS